MKNILFDLLCAQPSFGSKYHGGGEYTKAIFEHLTTKYNNNTFKISVFYNHDLFWMIGL